MDATLEDALRLAAEDEPVPGLVLAGAARAARRAADPVPRPRAFVAQERKFRGCVRLQKADGNLTARLHGPDLLTARRRFGEDRAGEHVPAPVRAGVADHVPRGD